jgi:hypothetical protein
MGTESVQLSAPRRDGIRQTYARTEVFELASVDVHIMKVVTRDIDNARPPQEVQSSSR